MVDLEIVHDGFSLGSHYIDRECEVDGLGNPKIISDGCRFEAVHAQVQSWIFSFLHLFKHTLCNNFKQAVGPGVLQTFSTCAVKP